MPGCPKKRVENSLASRGRIEIRRGFGSVSRLGDCDPINVNKCYGRPKKRSGIAENHESATSEIRSSGALHLIQIGENLATFDRVLLTG
jgi:hypothetical protein